MNELIFFAIIIIFTIIEAVSKARKRRAEGEEEIDEGMPGAEPQTARRPAPRDRDRDEEPSETMIPADIWEEIAGLARGQREEEAEPVELAPAPRRAPEPKPVPTRRHTPAPRPRYEPKLPVTRVPTPRDPHPMQQVRPQFGMDPSERTPSRLDWRPEVRDNRNAKRVRAMLSGREGADALKQAVILREVLGPPLAMRDE